MSKNVLSFLNGQDVFWVDILCHKYGNYNCWSDFIPAKCSWFFRGLFRIAQALKPFLWIKTANLSISSILLDPLYFEIPLAFKLTYLNMDVNLDFVCISDFVVDFH